LPRFLVATAATLLIPFAVVFATVLTQVAPASATTFTVCASGCTDTSIQSAVDVASAGDTIAVAAGTYNEQVSVSKSNLTIEGVGPATVIQPTTGSATVQDEDSSSELIYPVVDVTPGTTGVTLENLVIDGSAVGPTLNGCGGDEFVGVLYQASSGEVSNVTVENITDPGEGCGGDQAILVQSGTTGGTASVTVTGSTITGYGKNGVKCMDAGSTCTITDNTITTSSTGEVAQNGIEVSFGATGTVSGNTVSSTDYTGSNWTASGILLADVSGVTVNGNLVSDAQSAIVLQSFGDDSYSEMTGDTVSDNYISYTSSYDDTTANATNGTTGVDLAAYAWGIFNPSVSASIIDNDVEGPGNSGSTPVVDSTSTGLQIGDLGTYTSSGVLDVTATGNVFAHWTADVTVVGSPFDSAFETPDVADATVATGSSAVSASVNYNEFLDASVGVYNASGPYLSKTPAATIDATENWWGCSGGPGSTGCTSVLDNSALGTPRRLVTYLPWLAAVAMNPSSQVVGVGGTAAVGATLLDSNGNAVPAPLDAFFTTVPNVGSALTALSSGAASLNLSDGLAQTVSVDAAIGFGPTPAPSTLAGSATVYFTSIPITQVIPITQFAPFGSSVTTTGSAAFTDTLKTSSTGVTFSHVSTADLSVSSTGKVTTTGSLGVGTYSISGTNADSLGDMGSWSYTLTVTAAPAVVLGGPPIIVKGELEVVVAAVGPWTLFINRTMHFRVHLYGHHGMVSGVVSLEYRGKTLCTPALVHGVGHCTVSSSKIGPGRRWLLVNYAGSGFYKPLKRLVNVYVH